MGAFILMLAVVVVVVSVATVKSSGNNADAVWKAAAQRLGLRFERADMMTNPTISGTRRGLSILIDTFIKSGDNSRTYTRYRVSFEESLGLGLRLTRQGPLSGVSKNLGTQDIATGDDDFDESVVVKGRNPEQISRFLTPSRRLRAVRFLTLYPGSWIDDVKIECETRNVERSSDRIVKMVQQMTSLAEHFTSEEDNAFTYLATLEAENVQEPEDVSDFLPEDPEHEEDCGVTHSDLTHLPDPAASRVELLGTTNSQSTNEETLSIRKIVEELFTQVQVTELFTNEYKGQTVNWIGTITNVRSFRFDLVFGDVPGARAEFTVNTGSDDDSADRPVKAVVQFVPEAEDSLRALVDKTVAFQGVLFSCDAFMKTLFLIDGQIGEVKV